MLDGLATGHARLFRPQLSFPAEPIAADLLAVTDYGGPLAAVDRAGQSDRHAISSGKEPDGGTAADRELSSAGVHEGASMSVRYGRAGRTRRRRAPDAVFRHRSRRSVRGDRERDRRRRRFRLDQGAAAPGAGELLEGRAAGAGAAARRRAARRRHRRLGAARRGRRATTRRRPSPAPSPPPSSRRGRAAAASATRIVSEIEALARELGLVVLNLDLRDTPARRDPALRKPRLPPLGHAPVLCPGRGPRRAGPLLLQAPRRAGRRSPANEG